MKLLKAIWGSLCVVSVIMLILAGSAISQTEWTKYEGNPVLNAGPVGAWDGGHIYDSPVIVDETAPINQRYKMWYGGYDGSYVRTGYATSPDGINWTKYNQDISGNSDYVLDVGPQGAWDYLAIYVSCVLFHDGEYKMWYVGIDGHNGRIGYAISPDGINWTKYNDPGIPDNPPFAESTPVLKEGPPGAWDDKDINGASAIFDGTDYQMWYSGHNSGIDRRIGYASSSDGINWTKYNQDISGNSDYVLSAGLSGTWESRGVLLPSVVLHDSEYEMWYAGYHSQFKIGYATSPDGITWTKHEGNPVMDLGQSGTWDDAVAYRPNVVIDGNIYKMWYSGASSGAPQEIGYATSVIPSENLLIELGKPVNNLATAQGEKVEIQWTGNGPTWSTVSLRRDDDSVWNNGSAGETWIALSQPVSGIYEWDTTGVPLGTYYIAGMITDGADEEHNYAPGTVTIEEPPNTPPYITSLTADPPEIDENSTSILTVVASDDDGHSLTYQWNADKGSITGSGSIVTYNPPDVSQQITDTVSVTVSDGYDSDTEYVEIIVNPGKSTNILIVAESLYSSLPDGVPNTNNPGSEQWTFRQGETVRITFEAINLGEDISMESALGIVHTSSHTSPEIELTQPGFIPKFTSEEDIRYFSFDWQIPLDAELGQYDILGIIRDPSGITVYEDTGNGANTTGLGEDAWTRGFGVFPEPDGTDKYHALLIGCGADDEEPNPGQEARALNDIQELQRTLVEHGANWDQEGITTIANAQVTKPTIINKINTIGQQMDGDDVFLFYYVGHSYTNSLALYNQSAFTPDDLRSSLNSHIPMGAKSVVILNNCFSGIFVSDFEGNPRSDTCIISSANSSEMTPSVTIILITPKDITLFGYYLCNAIDGGADDDENTKVYIDEIYKRVSDGRFTRSTLFRAHPQMYCAPSMRALDITRYFTPSETIPIISLNKPDTDITIAEGDYLEIAWGDSDSDDNALISLARDIDDVDQPWATGEHTWLSRDSIIISEDPDGNEDHYFWNTNGVIPGIYVLWAMIHDDKHAPRFSRATGRVRITDNILDIQASCPVDLVVTDPEGRMIGKDGSEIPFARYIEEDLTGDSDPDDKVTILDPLVGDYTIEVVAEPSAQPTDTYTLDVNYGDESIRLAENAEIQEIPPNLPSFFFPQCNIEAGWNLISIPVQLNDSSREAVLQSVDGQYSAIWAYDAVLCEWSRYIVDGPGFLNNFETVKPGKGYWLEMSEAAVLEIDGDTVSNEPVPLNQGWNLVGYNSVTSQPLAEALRSINGKYDAVWTYLAKVGEWQRFIVDGPDFLNNLEQMQPGKGYWIDANIDCIWTISQSSTSSVFTINIPMK